MIHFDRSNATSCVNVESDLIVHCVDEMLCGEFTEGEMSGLWREGEVAAKTCTVPYPIQALALYLWLDENPRYQLNKELHSSTKLSNQKVPLGRFDRQIAE